MKKNWLLIVIYSILVISLLVSCHKEEEETNGSLVFKFDHRVNNDPLIKNQMIYTNAAGNHYKVTNIQWFLSDITLYRRNQTPVIIARTGNTIYGIHYVDTDMPSTWTWSPDFKVPEGDYDSVSFVFGIDAVKNQTGIFRDNPEAAMFWPDIIGGGYHYMKFNGFWKDTNNVDREFNYHLGIGHVYVPDTNFIPNYFTVSLNKFQFSLEEGKTKEIQIIMNIEHWFTNPLFDFNHWGGSIMDNQQAMAAACQNGRHVFSIGYIRDAQ